MLKNYLLVSIRSLFKNKLFATINLFGLAMGIASFFLVFLFILYHNSFDAQYKEKNMYRVLTDSYATDAQFIKQYAFSMHFLAPALEESFTDITGAMRMFEYEQLLVFDQEDILFDRAIVGVDSNAIEMLGLDLLAGSSETALTGPRSAVLTASFASRVFGEEDPLGKSLEIGYGFHTPWNYKVTGVVADLPDNTHMRFDVLTSAIGVKSDLGDYTIFNGGDANYHYPMFDTYLEVKEGTDITELEARINAFIEQKIGGRITEEYGKRVVHLQAVEDIHLKKGVHPDYLGGMERRSLIRANETDLRTIRWVTYGAFVLLIFSIFNYINLTYINSINRFKEIALRKIFGANLAKLFTQFFIESLLLTLIAASLALLIVAVVKPYFYAFLDIPESYKVLSDSMVYVYIAGLILSIVLLKSILLFAILLSVKYITIKRGNLSENKTGIAIRKFLMIVQLTASFILISGTLLLSRQIDFFMDKDLGFEKSNLLVIKKYSMASGLETVDLGYLKPFKDALKKSANIENVCLSTITPGFFYNTSQQVWVDDKSVISANTVYIDHEYQEVYGMPVLAGRFFTDQNQNEVGNVVINRKLMSQLGFKTPKEAIGQKMSIDDVAAHYVDAKPQQIIGVIEDFYQEPLSKGIAPMKFHLFNANRGFYSIRLKEGANKAETMAYVKEVFNKFYPKDNLNAYFLDDFLHQQYKPDRTIKKVMQIYTYTSILVAYLGLFAFSIYLIRAKRKAIAIRTVLGSTPTNITMLLLKEYVFILLIALVVALPLAISVMGEVLATYSTRISLGWVEFALTFAALSLVVLGTIASQAAKATFQSPIKSLRDD